MTLTIKVVNVNSGCTAVSGANVEIWHCDVSGNYSQYGTQTTQTYLRGIQTTNSNGEVTFTTIYPGWYQGRATHIHAEVTIGGRSVKVTQIAFPEAVNNTVHASGVYASRGSNPMSNASDGIFADSLSAELVTPTGSVASGYAATFQMGLRPSHLQYDPRGSVAPVTRRPSTCRCGPTIRRSAVAVVEVADYRILTRIARIAPRFLSS